MSDYDDYDEDFESDGSPVKSSRAASSIAPSARSERPAPVSAPVSAPSSAATGTRGQRPPAGSGAAAATQRKRANSSSSHSRGPAAAQNGRSSSSLGRRMVTPPASLQPLPGDGSSHSVADASQPEMQELQALRKANLALRSELLSLNRKLDDQLGQRGQRGVGGRAPIAPKPTEMLPSDKLQMRNDEQRRINSELREALTRPHVQQRMSETANSLGAVKAELEQLKSEAQGLENVRAHQEQQLARIRIVEGEMQKARDQHAETQRGLKDAARELKEKRERDMAVYSKTIRQVERMEEKLKVQDEVGAAVKSVDAVREQVEEKDRMIDALKYQVAVLSRTNAGDKKKARDRKSVV